MPIPNLAQSPWKGLLEEQRNLNKTSLTYENYHKKLKTIIDEHSNFKSAKPQGIMAGQKWFYASKMNDIHFFETRKHHKFAPVAMLPIGCGYGLATHPNLKYGPTFCYTEQSNYIVGFNRDINSSAHIEQIGREDRSWINNNCVGERDPVTRGLITRVGREASEDKAYKKTKDYDLWMEDWSIQKVDNKDIDLTGKIFIKPHVENGKTYIHYKAYLYKGIDNKSEIKEGILRDKEINTPFEIGYLRPLKESILEAATGYSGAEEGNRAKPRKTAPELYNSMRSRWENVLKANQQCRPIFYKTESGKIKDNAGDYSFYKKKHTRRKNHHDLECQSLKYVEALIKLSPDNLSHLIITEGIVGKAFLGNVIWQVIAQQAFLEKYNRYLPIHIYNHQTGIHTVVPEENLKFLYMLSYLLPLFSQDELDTDFYYLLEEEGQDKFTSLTTNEGLVKACDKILTEQHLTLALKELDTDPLKTQLILEFISPKVLKGCKAETLSKLKTYVQSDPSLNHLYTSKMNDALIELKVAVSEKNLANIKLIIEQISSEKLKKECSSELAQQVRVVCSESEKWSTVALFDKKMQDYFRFYPINVNTPSNLAPARHLASKAQIDWEQVLEIASLREKYRDWKAKGLSFKDYRQMQGAAFHSLGYALYEAALRSRWDVVEALIVSHEMTHYGFSQANKGYTIHLAIEGNRLDIIKLMHENESPGQDDPVIEQKRGRDGMSPLHYALITPGREHIAVYLLEQGASYESLLTLTESKEYYKYLRYILSYGKPLNLEQAKTILKKCVQTTLIEEPEKINLVEILLVKARDIITDDIRKGAINSALKDGVLKDLLSNGLILPPDGALPDLGIGSELPPPYFERNENLGLPILPPFPILVNPSTDGLAPPPYAEPAGRTPELPSVIAPPKEPSAPVLPSFIIPPREDNVPILPSVIAPSKEPSVPVLPSFIIPPRENNVPKLPSVIAPPKEPSVPVLPSFRIETPSENENNVQNRGVSAEVNNLLLGSNNVSAEPRVTPLSGSPRQNSYSSESPNPEPILSSSASPTPVEADQDLPEKQSPNALLELFLTKHKKSYTSGLFSFFHKTELKAFYQDNKNRPEPMDLIAHARKTTFFGYKNRTRLILEEMGIMNTDGTVKNPNFN